MKQEEYDRSYQPIYLSEVDKKETLEEVAENNYCFESDIEMVNFIIEMAHTGKIPNRWSAFVAKINELYLFKQEQGKKLYSEEWWSNLSDKFYESNLAHDYKDGKIDYRHIRNWFLEQFKNK